VRRCCTSPVQAAEQHRQARLGLEQAPVATCTGGGSQQQKKPDDVIDAEYVDVDESKRPN